MGLSGAPDAKPDLTVSSLAELVAAIAPTNAASFT